MSAKVVIYGSTLDNNLKVFEDNYIMIKNNLRQLLFDYKAPTAKQNAIRMEMLQVLKEEKCFESTFCNPGHFTSSAFVLSPDEKSVALIFHPFLQIWIQPGGHIESTDQSIQNAAHREIEEEIAIENVVSVGWCTDVLDLDIHQVPANSRKNLPPHKHFDVRFIFKSLSWDLAARNEIKDAKWVRLRLIQSIETDASVCNSIKRILELQQHVE